MLMTQKIHNSETHFYVIALQFAQAFFPLLFLKRSATSTALVSVSYKIQKEA